MRQVTEPERRGPSHATIAGVTLILRCGDLTDAGVTIAALYGVSREVLEQILPVAAERAQDDQTGPIGALPAMVAAELRRDPVKPAKIHYFHGTRSWDPKQFLRQGLRPFDQVLEALWQEIGLLVPELSDAKLRVLRNDLMAGETDQPTYSGRVEQLDHGPFGHLLRDVFLSPGDYGSVDYLAGAEIVIDICRAIEQRTGLEATSRYRHATTPCVVEFWVATRQCDGALAAALWYLAAGLREQQTSHANWTYCADGQAVPADEIVSVLDVRGLAEETKNPAWLRRG
jgi:hypothetical protein